MTQPIDGLNCSSIRVACEWLAQVYSEGCDGEGGDGDRPFSSAWITPRWDWSVRLYDQVTSTNCVLWEQMMSQEDLQRPLVAIARQQTQGKGQRSRQWHSALGGLYLSAGFALDCPVQMKAMLTLSTAWGIAEGLARVGVPIGLKWPNDLVVGGKKLGGILIETRVRGDRLSRVVVGVGLNWTNPVPDSGLSLHSLIAACPQPVLYTLNEVAALVLLGIQAGIERWRQEGSGAIACAYETFWVNGGQWVTLSIRQDGTFAHAPSGDHARVQGRIRRIHESGDLVVEVPPLPGRTSTTVRCPPGTIALGYGQ